MFCRVPSYVVKVVAVSAVGAVVACGRGPSADTGVAGAAGGPSGSVRSVETAAPTLPSYRPHGLAPPAAPPPAPAVAPPAVTVTFTRTSPAGASAVETQVMSRRGARVHVRLGGDGAREWLFARNRVDPRRVDGQLVDHRAGMVLTYDDSALAATGVLTGWRDALTVGVDVVGMLEHLEATGETVTFAGEEFVRYVGVAGGADLEVWWSDGLYLPLEVVTGSGRTASVLQVTRIERQVEPALLAVPTTRFPTYDVVDIADWGEEGH